jgi:hypothetical protein
MTTNLNVGASPGAASAVASKRRSMIASTVGQRSGVV